jgi:hypothetical protein
MEDSSSDFVYRIPPMTCMGLMAKAKGWVIPVCQIAQAGLTGWVRSTFKDDHSLHTLSIRVVPKQFAG